MSCTVIIVGYNAANRFPKNIIYPDQPRNPPVSVVACSPTCIISKVAVTTPNPKCPGDPGQSTLAFASSTEAKPAECYVLTFCDCGDAESWLRNVVPVAQLVGKIVLVLDPAVSAA